MASVQRQFAQGVLRENPQYLSIANGTIHVDSSDYIHLHIDPTLSNTFIVVVDDLPSSSANIDGTSTDVLYFKTDMDPKIAGKYPGLEYTVHFRGADYTRLTIDFYPTSSIDEYDILSPVDALYNNTFASVTLRSVEGIFTVVASGPQAWSYGYYDA